MFTIKEQNMTLNINMNSKLHYLHNNNKMCTVNNEVVLSMMKFV